MCVGPVRLLSARLLPVPKRARLFLADSTRDRAFVERLARVLDVHRIPYWYSKQRIVGAQQWHDEIGKGLAACKLSWTLKQRQWVYFKSGFDAGCHELLRIWGRKYKGEFRPKKSRATVSQRARALPAANRKS